MPTMKFNNFVEYMMSERETIWKKKLQNYFWQS